MLQFYFLSVLLNLITGLILFCSLENIRGNPSDQDAGNTGNPSVNKTITGFLDSRNFRLVLGVLSVLVGLMKLLSVIQNDVPVVGDLIPAVAGITGGFCILLEYYMNSTTVNFVPGKFLQSVFIDGRKFIGIFCIVAAVLHFIFPRVLFL